MEGKHHMKSSRGAERHITSKQILSFIFSGTFTQILIKKRVIFHTRSYESGDYEVGRTQHLIR